MKKHITFIESILLIAAQIIGFYGYQQLWETNTVIGQVAAVIGFVCTFILFAIIAILNMETLYET